MGIAFIPRSLETRIADTLVLCIYIVAQPAGLIDISSKSTFKTNHWTLHLATSDTTSIQLDPSPDANGTMTLIVSDKNSAYSDAVKRVAITTAQNLTVGDLINHLRSAKYLYYKLSASGQGCRYWLSSVIDLCISIGYLAGPEVEAAKDVLQFVWNDDGKVSEEEQSGIIPGEFM